jgi:pimeloyl-ACP methyl ester carboxylesterase
VLCGTLDILTPPALSVEMAGLAAEAELCLLDGVGHLSSMEAPEAVSNALEALFERAVV